MGPLKKQEARSHVIEKQLSQDAKWDDPELYPAAIRIALEDHFEFYNEIIQNAKSGREISAADIRFAYAYGYAWFCVNCPVIPPRQESLLQLTVDDWPEVYRKGRLLSTQFKTRSAYDVEVVPFDNGSRKIFHEIYTYIRPLTKSKEAAFFVTYNGYKVRQLSSLLQHFVKETLQAKVTITELRAIKCWPEPTATHRKSSKTTTLF